jgi:hypothetical protein
MDFHPNYSDPVKGKGNQFQNTSRPELDKNPIEMVKFVTLEADEKSPDIQLLIFPTF